VRRNPDKESHMTTSSRDFEDEILQKISEDDDLRARIEAVPDKIAATVAELTPVRTGTAKASIEVKARRSPWKRLSTRPIKVGEVFSDDDPAKIATLEYGRGADAKDGGTPEFAMFRRSAARWEDAEI
jgi:hypothetical protein